MLTIRLPKLRRLQRAGEYLALRRERVPVRRAAVEPDLADERRLRHDALEQGCLGAPRSREAGTQARGGVHIGSSFCPPPILRPCFWASS
jgi:hypothetical protein